MNKKVCIEKIEFSSFSDKATCYGVLYQGVLGYESTVIISLTKLNEVLNYLMKTNEGEDLYNYLKADTTEFGVFYQFNFSNLRLREISLRNLRFDSPNEIKICA